MYTVSPANNEFESKIVLSSFVGLHDVGLPPLESDQCAGSFQFPVPLIQYNFLGDKLVIVQPVLLPLSIELFAVNVAPPVALIPLS